MSAIRHYLSWYSALALLLAIAGCSSRERLDNVYGRTGGTPGGKSVNGTGVLYGMFKEAGHNVTTVTRLNPRLEKADTIVWAPDDFDPPDDTHRNYFERWLMDRNGRTLIYIGRDFDAEIEYWSKAVALAPLEQQAEFRSNLAKAKLQFDSRRTQLPAQDVYARWFMLDVGQPPRTVTTLNGPWSKGIDAKKCEITLATRFNIPKQADVPPGDDQDLPEYEVLLASQGDPLATRVTYISWGDSQIIVIPNGSYLLNLPLVNKEHRKLAGKLIDECMAQGETTFVESGPGGPPIHNKTEDEPTKSGFEMLTVWPLGAILMHGIVCLLLVSVCLYPIFGRPAQRGRLNRKHLQPADAHDDLTSGDFGKHLDALGELLSLTKDQQFAIDKLQYYQRHVKRESGVSHIGPPKALPATAPPTTSSPNP